MVAVLHERRAFLITVIALVLPAVGLALLATALSGQPYWVAGLFYVPIWQIAGKVRGYAHRP